jgi:arginine N-succinyltransferase
VNASRELGVHVRTPTLHLSNDMTDTTEICSLLLDGNYQGGGNGLLLSRCRFMFLDEFRKHFSEKVFAEMRGVSDQQGRSPLWDALGSKFFDMEFSQADMLSGLGNKSFIAELMPKYPIYLPMLPDEARAVIGRVHENTRPALKMLEAEGFNFNGMVDIFDGGPAVEAFVNSIRTVRESINRHAMVVNRPVNLAVPAEQRVMISNRSFRDFRVTTLPIECIGPDTVRIPHDVADALQVESGDPVRLAPLKENAPLPMHTIRGQESEEEKILDRVRHYRNRHGQD